LILLDTSGLFVAWHRDDPRQASVLKVLQEAAPPRILSPFVLAELEYLVTSSMGLAAESALLEEVARGAYKLVPFDVSDVAEAREVILQYSDLGIGLADASLVVLARRHGVHEVLTLDERHFRVLRGPHDRPFRLLPADA
jgi:predicted nucleic acid-binding protein